MQSTPRRRILVVDDDLRLRDLLKRYLSEQGFAVDTVPDAGKYDGMLGVLLAITAVEALEGRRLPFAVEVVAFSEEEGVRFRTRLCG